MEISATDTVTMEPENTLVPWLEKATEGLMKGVGQAAITDWLVDCGFTQDAALYVANKARDDLMGRTMADISTRLLAGTRRADIVLSMVHLGWEVQTASEVVNHIANMVASRLKDVAEGMIGRGLLWAVGGGVVTLVTYLAALSNGGGTYIVTTGAFIYGAYCILKGLSTNRRLP